jgi:Carboxypeptidase regulatory-like domain/TonB dependent receptor
MKKLLVASLLIFCFGEYAFPQLADTTALVGSVTDSAGAAMAGVSVVAVNVDTNDSYSTATTADGDYRFEFVKIGNYRITVKQGGFQTTIKTGIVVTTNQTVRNDFSLVVGQLSQNIEVTATNPPITTDDASVKETVAQKSMADLPLNGRDALKLAATVPGLLPGQKSANGVPPGEDFIAAGTREIQNSVSLDGISIMNNLISTTPFHPSVDAIQGLEVQTGTYTAQYGAYLGAHLNLISKNGTNDLHGAVYEFFRNDKLDAQNFFASAKTPLRQNQFGFEVAGPVFVPKLYNGRNRTFFMFDYEGLRLVSQANSLNTVLTPQMRQGDFSQLTTGLLNPVTRAPIPGNRLTASQLSPQAQNALTYYPLPNLPGITNNYSAAFPNNDRYNQALGRLDQNIGDKIRIFFRYAWQNENFLTGAANPFNGTTIPVSTRNWVVGYTQTISPTMVNDIRVGRQNLSTDALNYFYVNNLKNAGANLGIPGFNGDVLYNDPGLPVINITSYIGLGNAATNWIQQDTTWQGTDSLTWTHGSHTFIFGAELRKLITARAAVNNANGLFTFAASTSLGTGNAAADFIAGYPQSDQTPGPQINNKVAEWRDGFFFVDNWQVSKKLTMNWGLRYELPTVPYTANGYATILNASQTALIPANPPQPGFSFINPNHKNFAPRVGLAYRLTENTVFRAGYGIYYNPNQTNSFTFLSVNPPFGNVTTFNATAALPLTFNNPAPAGVGKTAPLSNTTIYTPNPNMPTQYMNQWSAGIQRGVWSGAALDISYLGSESVHLDRSYYINTPAPGSAASIATRRPNPLFGDIRQIQNDEDASYNGLTVLLRQRLSHGLTMLASYTWSHALDAGSDSNGGGQPMNPYNWKGDYGNANWDVRHRFVTSLTYELPFFATHGNSLLRQSLGGWQTNGIVTLQSGFPFNVIVSGDPANTGRTGIQRPNLIGTPTSNCGDGHLTNCIGTAAFALPAANTYGNAGRNLQYGPGLYNVDFSLFKTFRLGELAGLQFRSEFFNIFNTPPFSNPNSTFGTSNFGSITSTKIGSNNRQIQFALKLLF